MQLVRYDAMRYAVQAARDVDEVKDIRDKALAMSAYAKQANDTELLGWVTEIKVRAERKAGEMLAQMPKQQGARGTGKKVESRWVTPLLSELGISKNQSARWQKLAAVPEKRFEQAVAAAKEVAGEVTAAAMLRANREPQPAKPKVIAANPKLEAEYSRMKAELAETREALAEATLMAEAAQIHEGNEGFRDLKAVLGELEAVKRRRNELMTENSEQKKQIAHLERLLAKCEKQAKK